MFSISKLFVASLLAATVYAAPSKREDLVTCQYVFTPDVTVVASTTNLVLEFNSVILDAVNALLPVNTATDTTASTFVDNGNNTFNVEQQIGIEGKTAAETTALLTGFVGTTHPGFVNGGSINWTFNSVVCSA